jgi:hypothetical protein
MILLRAALGRQFVYDGVTRSSGEEFEGPLALLSTGLVVPADGNWRGILPGASEPASASRTEPPAVEPGAHPGGEACDPGPKPKGARTMQTCPVAGCPCLTWSGKCRAHARTSSASGTAYSTGHRNVSAALRRRWEFVRRDYLRAHPCCECPECAVIAKPLRPSASEVDHIDGLGLLGPRAFDPENLQSLTKGHHSRKTAGESFGR